MSARPSYFKIGLFTVLGMAAIALVMLLVGGEAYFRQKVLVETYFEESVHGLLEGSPVYFRGLRVGQVEHVGLTAIKYNRNELLSQSKPYVLVRMSIFGNVIGDLSAAETRHLLINWVDRGLRVRRGARGVTGQAYLSLDFHEEATQKEKLSFTWTPEKPYIPSAPGFFSRLTDTVGSVRRAMATLEKTPVTRISRNLSTLLRESTSTVRKTDLPRTIDRINGLIKNLSETTQLARKRLKDRRIDETLNSAAAASERVERTAKRIGPQTREIFKRLEKSSRAIQTAAGKLPEALEHFNGTLEEIETLVHQNQRRVANTVRNVEGASRDLEDLMERAQRNPSSLLFANPPPRRPNER